MNQLTKAPSGGSVRSAPTPVPPAPEVPSTYLDPAHPFPSALAELALVELHVLHSRITRQLGREYLDPAGPHPVTLDRAQELADELDTRQDFLPPAGTATPTEHRATTPQVPGTRTRPARRQPAPARQRPRNDTPPRPTSSPASCSSSARIRVRPGPVSTI